MCLREPINNVYGPRDEKCFRFVFKHKPWSREKLTGSELLIQVEIMMLLSSFACFPPQKEYKKASCRFSP